MAEHLVAVELYHSGAWQDVTSDAYTRDEIQITRGRSDESATTSPTRAAFTFDNRSGTYNPRNPASPLYGKIGRNTPLRISIPGAIDTGPRFDSASAYPGQPTGSFAWTHTPEVTDPRGILVLIVQNVGITDEVTGVTYGGVAMTRAAALAHTLAGAGEDGAAYVYHLGSGIPTGPQGITVTVNGTGSAKHGTCYSLVADSTSTVVDDTTQLDWASVTDPSVTLTTTKACFVASALHSDQDDLSANSPATGFTSTEGRDFGGQTALYEYRTEPAAAGSPTAGWDSTGAESAGLVGVAVRNGPDSVRLCGEVAVWRPERSVDDVDAWTRVEAAGVTRRLSQGASPLRSPLSRILVHDPLALAFPAVAHWPCEETELTDALGSTIAGVPSLRVTGRPDMASYARFAGTNPLLVVNTGVTLAGAVPAYAQTTKVSFHWLMHAVNADLPDETVLFRFHTSGTLQRWDIAWGAGGSLKLRAYDQDGTLVAGPLVGTYGVNAGHDADHYMVLNLHRNGADVDYILHFHEILPGATIGPVGYVYTGTANSQSVGVARSVQVAPNKDVKSLAFGHLIVSDDATDASLFPSFLTTAIRNGVIGWNGERAGRRTQRLADEESIPYTYQGDLDATEPLGRQRGDTLTAILGEAETTDMGFVTDSRSALGIYHRTRESLYNQDPALTLNYAAYEVAPPFDPVMDDQAIRNDVTVTRRDGGSRRVIQETGPLSVKAPPDGVGRYDTSVTVSVPHEPTLDHHAGWRLHLGTNGDIRFPQVTVDLDAVPSLASAASQVDIGDRILITGLPGVLSPDDASLIVQGYTETIGSHRRLITFNCTPETPWVVGVLVDLLDTGDPDEPVRYSPLDSRTGASFVAGTGTALVVEDAALNDNDLWSTAAGTPFDVLVSGVRLRVTAVGALSGGTQTLTVQQAPVNGVVKTIPAGSPVELWTPAVYALGGL